MKTFLFLSFTAMVLVPACTSTIGGGGIGECTKNADCGANEVCGFPESDACSAVGQCFPAPEAVCLDYSPGCACDGTEITTVCTGLPAGFVSKPLAYMGECVDAGSDASTCCPDGCDSGVTGQCDGG